MIIYLATLLDIVDQGKTLSEVGKRERLLSFYEIRNKKNKFKEYIDFCNDNLYGRLVDENSD